MQSKWGITYFNDSNPPPWDPQMPYPNSYNSMATGVSVNGIGTSFGLINYYDQDGNLLYVGDLSFHADKAVPEPITIDIKPGVYPNTINLGAKGSVPVAILTTADFDASTVDPTNVKFADASPIKRRMVDVDNDGDKDMLLYFNTQDLDLDINSTEATLTGQTEDRNIVGTDSVSIVQKGKNK